MAITVAALVADLNDDLNRAESDSTLSTAIKKALTRAVRWLSRQGRWGCLHTSKEDYAIIAGDKYIAYPDNYRELDEIVVNDGTNDSEPLERIEFQKWIEGREDESTADYDEPEQFVERNERFYLNPRPDAAYTVKVWYWRWHPAITAADSDILFGEQFAEAIEAAVKGAFLDGLKQYVAAQYWWGVARQEVGDLRDNYEDDKPVRVKYREMG